jgi:hypothetical protein
LILSVLIKPLRSYLERHADANPSFIPTLNANWERLTSPSASQRWLSSTSYETLKAIPVPEPKPKPPKAAEEVKYGPAPTPKMKGKQDEAMRLFLNEEKDLETIKEELQYVLHPDRIQFLSSIGCLPLSTYLPSRFS